MKTLLGLLLFSVLLATGDSLACETCVGQGNSCSGQKQSCAFGLDICQTIVAEGTVGGQTVTSVAKMCSFKYVCEQLKPGTTYNLSGVTATIKEVTCKAPSFAASLFLSLSGFLLLKILS